MNVQQHLSVDWRAEVRPGSHSDTSPEFEVGNSMCFLNLHWKLLDAGDVAYFLFIDAYPAPPTPLHAEAMLLGRAGPFLRQTVRVRTLGYSRIWQSTDSEVSEVLPGFQERPVFRFRVVIRRECDCADTGFFRTEDKSVQTPAHADAGFEIQSLSCDLSKLLDDDAPSGDVRLVCRGRTFVAHRCLLAVRSDVFRAMLESDMAEGRTRRVEIEDADETMFERFLEYLYKGRLEALTLDTATQLYKLADRYAVGVLKEQCGSYLEDNLTPDNACDVLSLADLHSDGDLKEIATAYIVAQKIIQEDRPEWSRFAGDHPQLAIEVMTRLCKLLDSCN